MRLGPDTAASLPEEVAQPRYDREAQAIGIVHFGIGAFHRAHQAWYAENAMNAGETGWAICGVSMRSRSVQDQLQPQGGLYTLVERSGAEHSLQLIGAVREVLFAPEQAEAVIERIASPDCYIVSFTVTEKGYARGKADTLDLTLAADSFYPLLADALDVRRERGLPGITLLSCDNLADNGQVLNLLMSEWIAAQKPELAEWFASECSTPATMIDRIVPRTTPEELEWLEGRLGMADNGAVFTERFSQWVIEDRFAGPRPAFENHGAQLVGEVAPYEFAKLRMLNGTHSMLAYCGLRRGYTFVHDAVADPELEALARTLMIDEAAPTVSRAQGQDLDAYADQLMERFADPALNHRLAQIAMDGTQKIPQRWLDTAAWHAERCGRTEAIVSAFDAWIDHVGASEFVDDPARDRLIAAYAVLGRKGVLDLCFGSSEDSPLWPDRAALRGLFE